MPIPPTCDFTMANLMSRCLNYEIAHRPHIDEIIDIIELKLRQCEHERSQISCNKQYVKKCLLSVSLVLLGTVFSYIYFCDQCDVS